MYWRIIKNDVMQSKLITIILTVFVIVASALAALSVILSMNLVGSVDTLMDESKTAHYMQMHAGDIDEARLEKFTEENDNVEAYETSEFLNIDGSKIQIGEYNFSNSVLDNGIVTQNEKFDFLLDMDNQPIYPEPGELYVPISLKKDGTTEIGDKVTISGKEFTVTGFVRDGEMNSPMAGSKRFLVHQQDFDELRSSGGIEYLIQFRLKDISKLNEFEAAYQEAELEMNGPTGTYHLFRIISVLSDGMMIAILLLVSLLVVIMAFMCIRFNLLAKIEQDYKEISVMKAIGLQVREIKKIYLVKYALIAVIGGLLGYFISLPISNFLLENIKLNFGESGNEELSKVFAIAGVLTVLIMLILFVSLVLKRFKKISAVEAIRFSGANEKVSAKTKINLRQMKLFSPNIRVGMIDIINRKKIYLTMLIVFILSSFIMIVPWMTYGTISDSSFIKFVGYSEDMDIMTSLYETSNSKEQENQIEEVLEKDDDVLDYNKIVAQNYIVKNAGETAGVLQIELGDHQKFAVEYIDGKAPVEPNEIALSDINAEEYEKKVGDIISILLNGKEKELIVCGIYNNVFNGGKTAKASFADDQTEKMWINIYIKLKQDTNIEDKTKQYKEELPFAKVNNTQSYRDQTYGATIHSVLLAALGSLVAAVIITALITSLFMKLLITKDKREIAILKSLGFTNADISRQYLSRSIAILVIGLVLGTFISMTVGKVVARLIVSSLGGPSIKLIDNLLIYLGCPLLMLVVTTLATNVTTHQIGEIELAENLKD